MANPIELDWGAIKEQAKLYDDGVTNDLSTHAKMLELAFLDGYHQCIKDNDETARQFSLLMSAPAGNA